MMKSASRALEIDELVSTMSDGRRRTILRALVDAPEDVLAFETLVDRAITTEPSPGQNEPPGRRAVAKQFQHVHLPKLADEGLVEYDRRSGQVRYRGTDRAETLLRSIEQIE